MIPTILFLFVPCLFLFGYQNILESKGINDPTLSISLLKTTVLIDVSLKLLLVFFVGDLDVYSLIGLFVVLSFFLYFYVYLSLYVPKTSLRASKKFPSNTNYTICALKTILWSCLSLLVNLFLLFANWTFDDAIEIAFAAILSLVMVVLMMILAARSLIRLDRIKYPSTRSLYGLARNNSPIILLRSFLLDSNVSLKGKVFDETICENLDLERNPIISLANPDEILPSGGSLKIQAKDSEWKEVVKEVLYNCRAVVLVEGLSSGLHWEISKIKEYVSPEQLFIMIPSRYYRELAWCFSDDAGTGLFSIIRNFNIYLSRIFFIGKKERNNTLDSVWKDFSERLNQEGIHTPTKFPGDNILICFDSNWEVTKMMQISDMRETLSYITNHTQLYNHDNFDYSHLAKKIESFEVNGFLSEDAIAPFKKLVDKCNRIGRLVSLLFFCLFIIVLILF